jgi:hypothetical protein
LIEWVNETFHVKVEDQERDGGDESDERVSKAMFVEHTVRSTDPEPEDEQEEHASNLEEGISTGDDSSKHKESLSTGVEDTNLMHNNQPGLYGEE